jgi:hypothetical protein
MRRLGLAIHDGGPRATDDDVVLSKHIGRHVEVATGLFEGVDISWDPIAMGVEISIDAGPLALIDV